ncbi:MAG: hypothetical protein AAF206_17390 [Bacteroidota bacterium]
MKRIILIVLLSVLVIGGGAGSYAVFGTLSDGSRVGNMVKFSRKGVVFKTYEGELNLGGLAQNAGGDLSEIWKFSVHRGDESIIQEINTAMEKGHRVRLHYKEKFFQFDWRGDTKYFIDQVDIVED